MHIFISVLILIVCLLLLLVVLIQNSKGGGLASNFASSNQIVGVRKTADFLEKTTWTLAITLLLLCLVSSALIQRNEGFSLDPETKEFIDEEPGAPSQQNQPPLPEPQE